MINKSEGIRLSSFTFLSGTWMGSGYLIAYIVLSVVGTMCSSLSLSSSGEFLLCPDTREVILTFFSSNGLYRASAKLSGTCPTVVAFRSPFVFFIFTTFALCQCALEGSGMQLQTSFIRGLES